MLNKFTSHSTKKWERSERITIIIMSLIFVYLAKAGFAVSSSKTEKNLVNNLSCVDTSSSNIGAKGIHSSQPSENTDRSESAKSSIGIRLSSPHENIIQGTPLKFERNLPVSEETDSTSTSEIGAPGTIHPDSSSADTTLNLRKKPKSPSSYLPDLQGLYFWWKSQTVNEGDNFWVRVTVNNSGVASAGPSHVKVYLSTDNDWDVSDDHYLGKKSVKSLEPGSYENIQYNFTFPDLESGSYSVWIVAVVDCDNEVTESNEINTWKCNTSFTANDPLNLADLQVSYFWYKSETVSEGDPYWVRVTVHNGGSGPAGSSHVKAYLSTDHDWDISDDYYLGKNPVSSMLAGGSRTVQWDFDFPDLGSGNYQVWILAVVDCDDEVIESDEINLWKCVESFTVKGTTDLADLQGSYFYWKSETVNEGDPFYIGVDVNNGGSGSAGPSHVKVYLSTDNDWDVTNDYCLGKKSVGSLSPGNSETLWWDFNFPDLDSSSYSVWILAVMDCDDEVTESDELNTWKCIESFSVQDLPNQADLQGSYFWWKSATVNEHDPFWIKVNISNAGSGSAGSSHVKTYLSTDNDWDVSDDYYLGKNPVVALLPGDSDTVQWDFDFPDIGSGRYSVWLVAEVDCDNEVIESDENNTWKCVGSFTVQDTISGVPDISVEPATIDIYKNEGSFTLLNSPSKTHQNKKTIETSDEHIRGLVIPDHVKEYWQTHIPKRSYDARELKSSIDWSANDSPVKSQGSCGSCWAFSAVGLIENLGGKTNLSEQVIVSCAQGDCGGGWYWDALEYIHNYGIPPESCYPYSARNGDCADKCTDPAYLVKVQNYTPGWGLWGEPASVNDIKAALQKGPICVGMKVPEDGTFDSYTGGIYDYNGGDFPWAGNGHAVLVVGYSDDQQYFKVKNSWGQGWGENGYFRISYDDVTDDVVFGCYGCEASGVYTEGMENTFAIQNVGTSELVISSITTDKNWLEFTPQTIPPIPPSRDQKFTITVTDWDSVTFPEEAGTISITSNDPDEPSVYVTATAHHDSSPIPSPIPVSNLVVNPDSLTFMNTEGGSNPVNQTFEITNGGETIAWTITDDAVWLTVEPTSGSTTTEIDVITISINNSGLAAGNYTSTITVAAPSAPEHTEKVKISLTVLPTIVHFSQVDPTGDSRPVIIQNAEIENTPIQPGDEIGVFDSSLCVGSSSFSGSFPMTVTIWMEVSLPDGTVLPGAKTGNTMRFKIWQQSTDTEMSAQPSYFSGSGNFGEPLTVLDSLQSYKSVTQSIPVKPSMLNMISFNVMPQNLAVDILLQDLENLSIAKDDEGNFYIPLYSVNTINNVDLTNGYQIYITGSEDDQITNHGTPLELQDYSIALNNSKMFIIGYPYQAPYPVEDVFASIDSSVLVVQDNEGHFWIPSYSVNTLGNMQPGKGYQIFINDTVNFSYPDLTPTLAELPGQEKELPEPTHFHFQITGLPYAIVVTRSGGLLCIGDEVGVFANGKCVGGAVFDGEYPFVISAWEGLEEKGIPGFINGQTISLRVWKDSEAQEFKVFEQFTSPNGSTFRSEPFSTVSIEAAIPVSTVPTHFALDQNYPNPFNPETKISYRLPVACNVNLTIYNLKGNTIRQLASGYREPGNYNVTWNGRDEKGRSVNSGVYFYKLQAGKFTASKKLILIK